MRQLYLALCLTIVAATFNSAVHAIHPPPPGQSQILPEHRDAFDAEHNDPVLQRKSRDVKKHVQQRGAAEMQKRGAKNKGIQGAFQNPGRRHSAMMQRFRMMRRFHSMRQCQSPRAEEQFQRPGPGRDRHFDQQGRSQRPGPSMRGARHAHPNRASAMPGPGQRRRGPESQQGAPGHCPRCGHALEDALPKDAVGPNRRPKHRRQGQHNPPPPPNDDAVQN